MGAREDPRGRNAGPGPALGFVVYVAGVFLAGALLAYPLFLALQAAGVTGIPFQKLTLRCLELCALLGLWPLLRFLGLRGRRHWGYGSSPGRFAGEVLVGLAIGAASLAVVAAVLLSLEVRTLKPGLEVSTTVVLTFALKGLISGLAVAVLEETWFRGALHSAVEGVAGAVWAVAATALLYGLVHFVRPDVVVPADQVGWSSGFTVIAGAFDRLGSPGIVDSLLALVAAGVLLSVLRLRSGRIALCIGVHAGWVMIIRVVRKLSVDDTDAAWSVLTGHYDGVIGYLAATVFSLGAVLAWTARRRARLSPER